MATGAICGRTRASSAGSAPPRRRSPGALHRAARTGRTLGNRMGRSGSLGIIALVPDDWSGIVTVRHQVLQRLAKYYKVVWIDPARNWREFVKPSGPRFLASDRWSEPLPSMEVLTPGFPHPAF